jgi:hypothetical protein
MVIYFLLFKQQYLFTNVAHKSQKLMWGFPIAWLCCLLTFFTFLSSSQYYLVQIGSNWYVMLSSKLMSDILARHPKWLPWLMIGCKLFGNLWKSSELLEWRKPNLMKIVLGWSPSKFVSVELDVCHCSLNCI